MLNGTLPISTYTICNVHVVNNARNVLFLPAQCCGFYIHFLALVVRSNYPAAGESKVSSFLILPPAPVLTIPMNWNTIKNYVHAVNSIRNVLFLPAGESKVRSFLIFPFAPVLMSSSIPMSWKIITKCSTWRGCVWLPVRMKKNLLGHCTF